MTKFEGKPVGPDRVVGMHEHAPELRFASIAPTVWSALGELKRTGWVKRGVKNPESVQEHTISLRNIAAKFEGISPEDMASLLNMLEVHDWAEAIHGDEVIISTDAEELKLRKSNKFDNEKRAMDMICEKLGGNGEKILGLWLRFETSPDDIASLARQLDKYQAIQKALEFEKEQGIPLFKEFLDYSRSAITHPILLEKIKLLEQEFADIN